MSINSTVYFLGAGASADAKVPLTNELLKKVYKRIRTRKDTKNKNVTELKRFIESFGFLNDNLPPRAPIVDAISLLDTCIRDNRPLDNHFEVDTLREVRTRLIIQLSEVIHGKKGIGKKVQIPADALDQPGAQDLRIAKYFQQFAKELQCRNRARRGGPGPGDTIITTNYDTNIDVALYELVYWQDSTGDARYSHIYDVFLGSDFRDPYSDEDALKDRSQAADLFKLHGSLNWLYCPRCSRIYVAAFCFSVRFIDTDDDWERTCWCGHVGLEPVIVAPSVFQELTNPHLQSIWINAYHALENADRWVFVGYSLPGEDLAIRSLLYRALASKRDNGHPLPEVEVVAPEPCSLKPRYVGLLGKKIQFIEKRFADYCAELAPA